TIVRLSVAATPPRPSIQPQTTILPRYSDIPRLLRTCLPAWNRTFGNGWKASRLCGPRSTRLIWRRFDCSFAPELLAHRRTPARWSSTIRNPGCSPWATAVKRPNFSYFGCAGGITFSEYLGPRTLNVVEP